MSSGLMSCVRENSPPLDLDLSAAGPLSLPENNSRSHACKGPTTSTPIASPVGADGATNEGHSATHPDQQQQHQQQQKRRRFHPLRNLRRIFRRRTINSADSSSAAAGQAPGAGSCNTLPPPTSSSSEKNLRNAAQSSAADTAPASSPVSPLTHQQLPDSYQTQSLPKSKSHGSHRDELLSVLLGKKRASKQTHSSEQSVPSLPHGQPDAMYQTQRQHMGVAVFPDVMSMSRSSYFAEKRLHQRQLRSVSDSTHELDVEDSAALGGNADMSDSQRSLSEERLLDVDVDGNGYTRETLSQSHDSVFSESATASSLSIVLKAELTDVLRKRRNRPDASDEDLGLPRSPNSPQHHVDAGNSRKTGYQPRGSGHVHEVSSLSLASVNSTDGEDSQSHRYTYKSNNSSMLMSSDILRSQHDDEVDEVGSERQRLSHAAAKHKMAIRPAKKKGPSRQHRRTLETSIPEANEELAKLSHIKAQSPSMRALKDADLKTKTRSLPPGSSLTTTSTATAASTNLSNVRTKTIEQRNTTITNINSEQKSSTSSSSMNTKSITSSSSQAFGLRSLTFKTGNGLFDARGESSTDGDDITNGTADPNDAGFLRRLIQRNSKRSIARANDGQEDLDSSQNVAKKLQISTSCLEATPRDAPLPMPNKSRSATSHEQHIQETRQIIKREIHSEGKQGLQAMVSNFDVQPQPPTTVKPKSGPAARQRYMPQELSASSTLDKSLTSSDQDVTSLLSRNLRGADTFQSTALVREQTKVKTETTATTHFERKPKIVGLSAFQQKLSRSSDSMGQHSSSSNSLETSTDEPSALYYEEKQRKTVEKARSFRNYQEERDVVNEIASMHSNMPSLPDLSISFRVPASYYKQTPPSPRSPMSPAVKCVSLGFEINDNKQPQARTETNGKLSSPVKISPQRATKLLLNNSPIEPNPEVTVKPPLVSVLHKSSVTGEQISEQFTQQPPQRPKVLELKQTTTTPIKSDHKDVSSASPLAKSAKLSNSPPSSPAKPNRASMETNPVGASDQPEFMKIQLNRVDQARLHAKTNHLVLAKNVKAASTPAERSQSNDDLSMRRLSNESTGSVQIVERSQKPISATTPSQPPSISQPVEALGRQQRAVSANSLRSSYLSSSSSGGSNEIIASPAASPASTPSTPKSASSKPVEAMEHLEKKAAANRFSLEERKRLFLSEDKSQPERKLSELRKERKKCNSEELQRKLETPPVLSPVSPTEPLSPSTQSVVLRKKSFASSNTNSIGNATVSTPTPEDATPELMKVFARRSLKVKDDDVIAVAQVAVAMHKKMTSGSQSVDSDKENQSNSEEKLDKLTPKYDIQASSEPARMAQVHTQISVSNRSSVADFRNLNNNNNNNNNNQPAMQKLSNLPPIKGSNARQTTTHSNNNNINNNNNNNNNNNIITNGNNKNSNNIKPANERYSLQLKQATPTTVAAAVMPAAATVGDAMAAADNTTPTKPIERSATVGEFKGIHQRRAEWEQRVKEALK